MEMTVKLVSQINSASKPLAGDCFDLGGKTRPHCPVCDGKGGMKGCLACGGAGMSPDGSRQVRLCPDCRGRGYLHYEFSVTMRALIAKKRKERAARGAVRKD
jgi:DnaJ-class molecular chaperone